MIFINNNHKWLLWRSLYINNNNNNYYYINKLVINRISWVQEEKKIFLCPFLHLLYLKKLFDKSIIATYTFLMFIIETFIV